MSKKLYNPKRKIKKEKLSFIDRIEIAGITIAAIILIGWSAISAVGTFTADTAEKDAVADVTVDTAGTTEIEIPKAQPKQQENVKTEKPEKPDKAENAKKPEQSDETEKTEKTEKVDEAEKTEKSEKTNKMVKSKDTTTSKNDK